MARGLQRTRAFSGLQSFHYLFEDRYGAVPAWKGKGRRPPDKAFQCGGVVGYARRNFVTR